MQQRWGKKAVACQKAQCESKVKVFVAERHVEDVVEIEPNEVCSPDERTNDTNSALAAMARLDEDQNRRAQLDYGARRARRVGAGGGASTKRRAR